MTLYELIDVIEPHPFYSKIRESFGEDRELTVREMAVGGLIASKIGGAILGDRTRDQLRQFVLDLTDRLGAECLAHLEKFHGLDSTQKLDS